jgi:lipopolysaccharide export system permease protein
VINKLDRYIFFKLFIITFFVLAVLICIYILVDFSENSDDFVDKGASLTQIWRDYYLNYIPEMMRLVSPLAVLVACLFLTVQMTERLEIVAIKSTGISLYRLSVPYLIFGLCVAATISYLDAGIIPQANADRMEFESAYLSGASDRIDRGGVYRQDSDSTIIYINFYDVNSKVGYQIKHIVFDDDQIRRETLAGRLSWVDSTSTWVMDRGTVRTFDNARFTEEEIQREELKLNIIPRDIARRSTDVYQLSYVQAFEYIDSIRRIGAGGITLPQVQLYSRISYPISIIIVCLIGFALATERRKSGKGFYIASGLAVSFVYLSLMKVIEPFGSVGTVSPLFASVFPHAVFLALGIILLLAAKK